MLSSIAVEFLSTFACFSSNSGYKGMLCLVYILQIAVVIRSVLFLLFLPFSSLPILNL